MRNPLRRGEGLVNTGKSWYNGRIINRGTKMERKACLPISENNRKR